MTEHSKEHEESAGLLRRWSRRKQDVGGPAPSEADAGSAEPDIHESASQDSQDVAVVPAISQQIPETDSASDIDEPLLTDEDMPEIHSITKDTDVSCFFNRGVSEPLRQRALRHLLRLPAFNITDGLNDYDEDYTTFEPLGDIVTSDMRFQAKRKEKLAAQQEEEEEEALAAAAAEEGEADDTEVAQESTVADPPDELPETEQRDAMVAEYPDDPTDTAAVEISVSLQNNAEESESVPDPDNKQRHVTLPGNDNPGSRT